MSRIRILVVDDAVVVRRLVSDALATDPALEVVGSAANGKIALTKIPQVNPDVVILDVEMPEMNGLETLAEIRKTLPRLPVIMFSTLTERGAAATLDALALGANDYVTKPANVGNVTMALQRVRVELIPKIKTFCSVPTGLKTPAPVDLPVSLPSARPRLLPPPVGPRRVDMVAIGVSTGGPNALGELLPVFPPNFPVPVLIVQHMPALFTKLLAERLAAKSHIGVAEGAPGRLVGPGQAWLAPGDYHMVVRRDDGPVRILVHQDPPENSCRPAVDVLFRSVAEVYGPGALAVVMTGMGQDGLRGCEYVRETGGQVLVQDEANSVVWGMPGFVAKAGLADRVLPLDQLGPEIVRKVREREVARPTKSGPTRAPLGEANLPWP